MFCIRQATKNDEEAMCKIDSECFGDGALDPICYVDSPKKIAFVAEKEEIVGCVLVSIPKPNPNLTKCQFRSHGCIDSVAIVEGYRRRGIATALIHASHNAIVNEFGAKCVFLHVRESNTAAIRLYEGKLGYHVDRKMPGCYGGEDGIEMHMELQLREDATDKNSDALKSQTSPEGKDKVATDYTSEMKVV